VTERAQGRPDKRTDHWISEASPVGSGSDHTGTFKRQSVRVHLQALLSASPQAGLGVSATRKHKSLSVDSLVYFDPLVSGRSYPQRLMSISKIMCQAHASLVSLLSVNQGEGFTRPPMSQSLRAPAAL